MRFNLTFLLLIFKFLIFNIFYCQLRFIKHIKKQIINQSFSIRDKQFFRQFITFQSNCFVFIFDF